MRILLADRCSVSQQLGALQTHTTDTFLFISHTTNVLLFKFPCNIFMHGSVASGTLMSILDAGPFSFKGEQKLAVKCLTDSEFSYEAWSRNCVSTRTTVLLVTGCSVVNTSVAASCG